MSATPPARHGPRGARPAPPSTPPATCRTRRRGRPRRRWQAFADVAAHDLSLARLVEGHVDAVAILAELGCTPPPSGDAPGRVGRPSRRAHRHPSGGRRWVLDGDKPFCSGSTALDAALVTATAADGVRLFRVRGDAAVAGPGVVVPARHGGDPQRDAPLPGGRGRRPPRSCGSPAPTSAGRASATAGAASPHAGGAAPPPCSATSGPSRGPARLTCRSPATRRRPWPWTAPPGRCDRRRPRSTPRPRRRRRPAVRRPRAGSSTALAGRDVLAAGGRPPRDLRPRDAARRRRAAHRPHDLPDAVPRRDRVDLGARLLDEEPERLC